MIDVWVRLTGAGIVVLNLWSLVLTVRMVTSITLSMRTQMRGLSVRRRILTTRRVTTVIMRSALHVRGRGGYDSY